MEPVTRRTALVASAGVVATLAGCGEAVGGPGTATVSPSPDPDLRLVREALRREQHVQDRVARVRRSIPAPGPRTQLREVAAVHRDHLDLLRRATPGHDDAGTGPGPDHAGSPAEQVRRLAADERSLADAHAQAALQARSGPLARVLGGLAAAADQQAHVLDGLALEVPGG